MFIRLVVSDVVLHLDFPFLKVRNCNYYHYLRPDLLFERVPPRVFVNKATILLPHQLLPKTSVGEESTSGGLVRDRGVPYLRIVWESTIQHKTSGRDMFSHLPHRYILRAMKSFDFRRVKPNPLL